MKIIDRIKARTPKRNRVKGQFATALSAIALTVAESGLVNTKPVLKASLECASGVLGIIAVHQAQKVQK